MRDYAPGVAASIVFALPTQATANAMLLRAEAFAEQAFGTDNVVLAHSKRQFNANPKAQGASAIASPAQSVMFSGENFHSSPMILHHGGPQFSQTPFFRCHPYACQRTDEAKASTRA